MKIGGLDIGTTGCKLTVFDENGAYLGKAYRDYPVRRAVGGHEIDVAAVMDGVYAVIGEMSGQYPDIAGIGVTSFGETFVMTDGAGAPLHPAMLYTDPRGGAERRELAQRLGEKHIARITGLRPHEMYSISKMMWLRKNCPQVYGAAKHIFLIEDYVVWHLTGISQIDYSLATRTMAFDINTLEWSREIFDAAGIDVSLMSKPVPTGTSAGTVTAEVCRKTGLSPSAQIVSVSHDQVAAAVGAGAFDSSVAVDGAGTVECLTPIYDGVPDIEAMYNGYFSIVPYVVPGKYVAYAFSYTGGALLQWCVDTLAKEEQWMAKKMAISVNRLLEEDCPDRPTGLLVLPHFAGAATPYMDTGSKGAILGLTTATTLPELYRACMEGVAYEMRLNAEALAGSGTAYQKLHATGGGARSRMWMQMKADVLDVPITALETADAGTVGSAMLTGIAAGAFQNLEDAAAHMVRETETYYPNRETHAEYMKIYERYKRLYSYGADGEKITNQFDSVNLNHYYPGTTYVTRNDWMGTIPSKGGNLDATPELLGDFNPTFESTGQTAPKTNQGSGLTIMTLMGLDYDNEYWDQLLDQFTEEELMGMVAYGGFKTNMVNSINKPASVDKDSPACIDSSQLGGDRCYMFPSESMLACTWNRELVGQLGYYISQDCLLTGATGWYAPGVNIHRVSICGRSREYFSEDAYLSGAMAYAINATARDHGVVSYTKHFALNEQENNRSTVCTFAAEQAVREIYLKAFEMALSEGGGMGVMTSMNRVGTTYSSSHWGLCTGVLKNEWGFKGVVITDIFNGLNDKIVPREMVLAGTDLFLCTLTDQTNFIEGYQSDADVLNALRESAHRICYAYVNSNLMNGLSAGSRVVPVTPAWNYWLYAFDAVAVYVIYVLAMSPVLNKLNGKGKEDSHEAE